MERALAFIYRILQRVFLGLTGAALGLVFVVVLVNAISRYLFQYSFVWGGSMATYGMIYGTAFGVLGAYMQGLNIRFNIVTEFLSPGINAVLELISHVLTIAVGVALTISAVEFVHSRGGIVITGLNLTTGYMQAAMIVLGAGLALVASLKTITAAMKLLRSPSRGVTAETGEP